MPRPNFVLVLVAALVFAACDAGPFATISPRDKVLAELGEHRAAWDARNITDYTFSITRQCFCPNGDPIEITVVNGAPTNATRNGEPVGPDDLRGLPATVGDLFNVIAGATDAAKLTVEWHPLDYPVSIWVDPVENVVDEEFGYTVTALRPAS